MLRAAAVRRLRISFLHAHPRAPIGSALRTHGVRLNSTGSASSSPDSPPTANTSEAQTKRQKTPEEALKKAALERQDDLQRDWDAKKLTYEEFLPRTQNPSPVRLRPYVQCRPLNNCLGHLHHRRPRTRGSYARHDSGRRQRASFRSEQRASPVPWRLSAKVWFRKADGRARARVLLQKRYEKCFRYRRRKKEWV